MDLLAQRRSVPWRQIATSGPFLVLTLTHMCNNFGWYMLIVQLPTYMKQVLRFNIQSVPSQRSFLRLRLGLNGFSLLGAAERLSVGRALLVHVAL